MEPNKRFQFELRDLLLAVTLFALSLPGLCVLLRRVSIDDLSIWDLFAIAISPPFTGAAIGAVFQRKWQGFFLASIIEYPLFMVVLDWLARSGG